MKKILLVAFVALVFLGCQKDLVLEVSCQEEIVGQKRDFPDKFKRWDIKDFHAKDYVRECVTKKYEWE